MYLAPQPLRLYISGADLTTEGEQRKETVTFRQPDSLTREVQSYYTLSPAVGLFLAGSIYHPYFLSFAGSVRYGNTWYGSTSQFGDEDAMEPSTKRNSKATVWQYGVTATFVKRKPYATSLYSSLSTSIQDYDFFTRSTVDNTTYGVRSGYWSGPVPFAITFDRERTDETPSSGDPFSREDDTFTVKARNSRTDPDETSLDYSMNQYRSFNDSSILSDGVRHSLNIFDTEAFRSAGRTRLQSGLFYSRVESTEQSESLALQESLQRIHDGHLTSGYLYRFTDQTSGSAESMAHQAMARLTHQLYESLTSTVAVDGQLSRTRGDGSSHDLSQQGGMISEAYTKRIPADGRFTADVSVDYHLEDDGSGTGGSATTIDESHSLSGSGVVLLEQPNVDPSSVTVTDPTGTIRYEEGRDYRVIPRGDSVEIQRVFGGFIPEGQTVLVDYTSDGSASTGYSTLGRMANSRLNLFREILGIYGRLNKITHSGGSGLNFDDVSDRIVGLDLNVGWLSAGASRQTYDATGLSYTTLRYYEKLSFTPLPRTSVRVDLEQTSTTYADSSGPEWVYSYILRCDTWLTSRLSAEAEAGKRIEEGADYDRDLQTIRGSLTYGVGKLTLRVTGERSDTMDENEERTKQSITFLLKRTF